MRYKLLYQNPIDMKKARTLKLKNFIAVMRFDVGRKFINQSYKIIFRIEYIL